MTRKNYKFQIIHNKKNVQSPLYVVAPTFIEAISTTGYNHNVKERFIMDIIRLGEARKFKSKNKIGLNA